MKWRSGLSLPMMAVATAASAETDAGMTMGLLAQARERVSELASNLALAPGEFIALTQSVTAMLASGTGVRAVTYMLILLIIGIGTEWLYWTYAYAPLQVINSLPVRNRRHAFMLGMRRLALLGSGLLLFTLTVLGASAAFQWPPGVLEVLIAATFAIVLLRLVWLLLRIVLAPDRRELRLVDVRDRHVPWISSIALLLTLLLAVAQFIPDVLGPGAAHAARALQFACGMLASIILLIAAVFAFRTRRRAPGERSGRRLPEFPRALRFVALIVLVLGLWLLVGKSQAQVVAILGLVAALESGLHGIVFFFWKEDIASDEIRTAQLLSHGQVGEDSVDPKLAPSVVLAAARLVVVLIGLAACALVLGLPVMDLPMSGHPLVRFGIRLLGVAALALSTNVVWLIIKSAIDHRLRVIGPNDPHGSPGPNARLRTLLPLTRIAAAIFLASMFILSALWALGIEITPLLAGAGVLGIALGFGAQALVRDIIAGIFLLVEDVFRVGEYIESGSSTKGTVERITLRTVALRHHNGPLHFVPFGSLGVVRNNSRDWVIEKFNLPLPLTADSEKVRKMLKKIGQEMLDDPELVGLIHMPLKGKLYRVDPGLKIFRCSFQTAPGNQFDVRAAAYRRIEAAMKDMGLSFADGRQMIMVPDGAMRLPGIEPAGA